MYTEFYQRLGWLIEEPKKSVQRIVHQIQDETDVIICLSHLGIHEDRLLAEECKQIDVILGAHTHHLFMEGELVNETLLAATGKFAEYVGHITISLDESKSVIGKKAEVIHVNKMERREEDIIDVNALINAGNEAMEEKVFYNAEPLKQQLFKESSLSSFFGRAMIDYTDADCAMFNAGIFLSSLEKDG